MLMTLLVAACTLSRPAPLGLPLSKTMLDEAGGVNQEPQLFQGGAAGDYGMLYFSGKQGTRIVTALALNRLYENALPGYGLYTFVLTAAQSARLSDSDRRRQHELLRLIETYAAGLGEPDETPRSDSHVFVVPVRVRSLDAPLAKLVSAELADLMRLEFADFLRQRGYQSWARRIERNPGPFLISAPEPRLTPDLSGMPRLVVDLSGLGPEGLYELVDLYDRDLPAGTGGRPEALTALPSHLARLPTWARLGTQTQLVAP